MAQDLKFRTKKFAIDCWKLCRHFPNSREYNAYVNQLIRCSSSVGANYRASQRGKSTADFINKLKIVEEEADESHFFLELLFEIYDLKEDSVKIEINRLLKEANELVSIMVASINTAKNKLNNSK
ncbi:four helix bundle protein [Flavobacterium branchiophilum]|uniref:Four helix bundle protein n=1 Tax=Flavobacterium branchiophilum TaxID=55197 RepID=A0A2H3KWQ3_9FLAO|nr:four helix bundle protein [Flavobacterium branchiophilum]OXA70697.1 four helix bundle protein [Flavobacterium branchiophilum] [Flavobacterium branchiophilum NBRC 15030 = ATCC 35035]PDS25194.1 four helix bundle protein [Flavobacterium branchiophilum]TQM42158.1 four helix bundle protein [Flavobacterium branchiophilum]GEM54546.1 four helix bundle protein [Flavobacterium branchiophilum NBRC 15030 = ATCC 35035]